MNNIGVLRSIIIKTIKWCLLIFTCDSNKSTLNIDIVLMKLNNISSIVIFITFANIRQFYIWYQSCSKKSTDVEYDYLTRERTRESSTTPPIWRNSATLLWTRINWIHTIVLTLEFAYSSVEKRKVSSYFELERCLILTNLFQVYSLRQRRAKTTRWDPWKRAKLVFTFFFMLFISILSNNSILLIMFHGY